jgi:hypothetical protein
MEKEKRIIATRFPAVNGWAREKGKSELLPQRPG